MLFTGSIVGAIDDIGRRMGARVVRGTTFEKLLEVKAGEMAGVSREGIVRDHLVQMHIWLCANDMQDESIRLQRAVVEAQRLMGDASCVWEVINMLLLLQLNAPSRAMNAPAIAQKIGFSASLSPLMPTPLQDYWMRPRFATGVTPLPCPEDQGVFGVLDCGGDAAEAFELRLGDPLLSLTAEGYKEVPSWSQYAPYSSSSLSPSSATRCSPAHREALVAKDDVELDDVFEFERAYGDVMFGHDVPLVDETSLVRASMLVLQGTPSDLFPIRDHCRFRLPTCRIINHCRRSCVEILEWFCRAGDAILRLDLFAMGQEVTDDPVLVQLRRSVREYIFAYRSEITGDSVTPGTLLALYLGSAMARAASGLFQFAAAIERVISSGSSGAQLLSALYNECTVTEQQVPLGHILRAMFDSCFQLYQHELDCRLFADRVANIDQLPIDYPTFMVALSDDIDRASRSLQQLLQQIPTSCPYLECLAPSSSAAAKLLSVHQCQSDMRDLVSCRIGIGHAQASRLEELRVSNIVAEGEGEVAPRQARPLALPDTTAREVEDARKRTLFAELKAAFVEEVAAKRKAAQLERFADRQRIDEGVASESAMIADAKEFLMQIYAARSTSVDLRLLRSDWQRRRQHAHSSIDELGWAPLTVEVAACARSPPATPPDHGRFIPPSSQTASPTVDGDIVEGRIVLDDIETLSVEIESPSMSDDEDAVASLAAAVPEAKLVLDSKVSSPECSRSPVRMSPSEPRFACSPIALERLRAKPHEPPGSVAALFASATPASDDAIALHVGIIEGLHRSIRQRCAAIDAVYLLWVQSFNGLALLRHVQCLRQYMLMSAGDLFDSFVSDLFAHSPLLQQNPTFVNGLLRAHMHLLQYPIDPFSERVEFVVAERDSLRLRYTVATGPLLQVLTQTALDGYSSLFTFLLRVKRVTYSLRVMWIHLGSRTVLPRLHAFVQRVRHFTSTLDGYITSQVLDQTRCDFERDLLTCSTADDVCRLHDSFVESMRHGCFLSDNTLQVRSVLEKIFDIVLQFESFVMNEVDMGPVTKLIDQFDQSIIFLFRIQQKIAQHGSAMARDLLIRLNFNSFYSRQTTTII